MAANLNKLAQTLKNLHVSGKPLLLANVWDATSAEVVASQPSTKALATASYAIAAVQGVDDNDMVLEQNLTGIGNVVAGLRRAGKLDSIPLSADLQDAYGDPAATIRQAVKLGVVGANIEDVNNQTHDIRPKDEAVSRIRAALDAARDAGVPDFVVNARTDVLGYGGNIQSAIERGKAYLDAGATSVFVWGVGKWDIKPDEVKEMLDAFDGRLAVQPGNIGVEKLSALGVSRISVGPALWRKCKSVLLEEAQALKLM